MALDKPTIPTWAETADPTDMVIPAAVKQNIGWEQTEKPPSEWMNWLQRQFSRLGSFFSKYLGFTLNKTMSGTITWDAVAGTIAFAADLEISVFIDGAYYVNKIALADSPISIADGEVLVFAPTDSVATLSSAAYASLVEGKYSIVAAGSLAQQTDIQQIVLFYRSGTELAIPLFNQRLLNSGVLTIGAMQRHSHADNDNGGQLDHATAFSAYGTDNHTEYILASGTRAFSGNQSMGTHKLTAVVDPTDAQDASTKYYVDNYIPTTVADHDHTGDAGDGGRLVIDDVVAAADKTGSGDVVLQVSPKIYTLETEGVSGSDDTIDMKWYNEDSDISGIKHTTILTTQASAALAIPPGTTHILNEKRISVNLAATGAADAWHSVFTSKLTSAAYDNLVIRVTAFGSTFNAHSSYLIGTSQWYSQRGVGGTTSVGTMASGGACGQRMTWDGTDEFTYDVNRDDTESSRYFLIIECWEV